MAKAIACLIRKTQPKVFVLGRRWPISRRNSILCPFFWRGYVSGSAEAVYLQFFCLYLNSLSASQRSYQSSFYRQTGTCGNPPEQIFRKIIHIKYDLNVINGGSIVQSYKSNVLISSFCSYPAFDQHFNASLFF